MKISYSNHELGVIGLQCIVDFSCFVDSSLPKDICKRKISKKVAQDKDYESVGVKSISLRRLKETYDLYKIKWKNCVQM